MISDPNLILYACIAKQTTILARLSAQSSADPQYHNIAKQCLQFTPQFHATFSQTTRKRSYTFLIDNPFVYFAIHDEKLPKIEALAFLDFVKRGFKAIVESGSIRVLDSLTENCLQRRLEGVFRMGLGLGCLEDDRSEGSRVDSVKERGVSVSPLLGGGLMKKNKKKKDNNRVGGGGGDDDVRNVDDGVGVDDGCDHRALCFKDGLLSVFRIGTGRGSSSMYVNDMQTAKKVWRRHVVLVLVLDFFVCVVMFVIWLSVCKGFKCIDG